MTQSFAAPDADHSPAAYWFWHRLPTPEEIRSQVAEMLAGGYRSFQIQPRLAYPIADYLGDDYLAACQLAVAEAARLGMTVGIYDDYNWQSGQAGGRTVRGADHLRECHVFWSTAEPGRDAVARCEVDQISSSAADLGPAGMAWQYDDARMAWTDWRVIAALAHPREAVQSAGQIIDVTASALVTSASEAGCTTSADLRDCPPGYAVTIFTAARCATSRLPNYLLTESAQRFIEVGYQPYFATFGEHFGSTVKYFFFDQPHATFYDWAQRHGHLGSPGSPGSPGSSLPYAPELADEVRQRTERPFGTALLALVMDVGPETAALRCDFYQAYTELACSSYLGTLAAWCQDHGVALSGHEVLGHVGSWNPGRAFAGWDLRVNFGMDYFGTDSYRGITGVDAEDCVPQLSAKLGDSVARSNGRSGCIVEQYMAGRYTGGTPYTGDPSVTTLQSADTLSVIRSFAAGGGLLVSSGRTPSQVQRGDSASAQRQWADTTATHSEAIPSRQQARQALAPLLASRLHVAPAGEGTRLWSWTGLDEDGWRLAIFNDGPAPAAVTLTGPGEAFDHQVWDTQTGETGAWQPAPQAEPGGIRLQLMPMELRTLRLRPARDRAAAPSAKATLDPPAVEEPLTAGWTLRIPGLADTPQPVRVDRGWEEQGFPAYSGIGHYTCTFDGNGARPRRLRLPKVSAAVEVTLNGRAIGSRAWEPFEFELPELRETANSLQITVFSAAANKYYSGTPYRQHPEPSGLLAAPTLISY